MSNRYVYVFANGAADGDGSMKDILGEKGAGLAEMTNVGLPVPPGFTITPEAYIAYAGKSRADMWDQVLARFMQVKNATTPKFPAGMWDQVLAGVKAIEKATGKEFGGTTNPLLLSVRSGAKFFMPGMMDAVLNVGLNQKIVQGLTEQTSNERFALDTYRRFIQMFGTIVLGVDGELFDEALNKAKKAARATVDATLNVEHLSAVCREFKKIVITETESEFPYDPYDQLEEAIKAVFRSWNSERAQAYRHRERIPDDLGTGVNIQAMVFGNMDDDSGTGVAFTRNQATGENELFGDYLANAQGNDVFAGIRTPKRIDELREYMPEIYNQLADVARKLETHYKDMQDIEFTVERGTLWMLQTRDGRRTGPAAVRIAVEMVREGLIDEKTALTRITADHIDQLSCKVIDPEAIDIENVLTTGINASPGAVSGMVVFTSQDAEAMKEEGEDVILVRHETSPEDARGMEAALGILTSTGGLTSHAAVIARGWRKPCVVGASEIVINYAKNQFTVGGKRVKRGEWITVDGTTGRVILGEEPIIDPEPGDEFRQLMEWAHNARAVADTAPPQQ